MKAKLTFRFNIILGIIPNAGIPIILLSARVVSLRVSSNTPSQK
jgi:hypothetical protein